ncbi:putative methyltransferase NSUN7 [Syngnathus acus]|uniref:putative methyltransferase NSUN7 n=1 Tax=Syngnathus acus TaxID=161584 RepID=UPI001885D403|nr:putative methyltransferase NSUN7 [Syngnathus acus]
MEETCCSAERTVDDKAITLSDILPPSDQAFLQAAAIFQYLRTEKPLRHQFLSYEKKTDTLSLPGGGDKRIEHLAFQLAFSTLKYQELLEEMLMDSHFHMAQNIPRGLLPLAMVMLCDFRDRSFMPRLRLTKEGDEPQQEVRDLESRLHKCKTKLAASLARCRVKHSLRSISCILSEPVRSKQQQARRLPLYAWVNTLKSSVENVCEELQLCGMSEVDHVAEVGETAFSRDPLCVNTFILPRRLLGSQQLNHLTATHKLNIQDRSTSLVVSALCPLLFNGTDVLVAGSFSALTVAHMAIVATTMSVGVLVCGGDHTASQLEDIHELLKHMDVKNVRVLSEAFFSLDEWDCGIERLKVIVVFPQCSSSALSDPVDIIHREHGDWNLLQDLSRGLVSQSNISKLTTQQARLLARALTFPQVQTVLYCTRSVYVEENEQLVNRVLEKTHTPSRLRPFRVNGPIFPEDTLSGDTAACKFFKLEPSPVTNGCFVARLSRQADPTKVETVQEVLARAVAKGLLDGIFPGEPKTKKENKKNPAGHSDQEKDKAEVELEGDEDGKAGRKRKVLRKRRKPKIKSKHAKVISEQHSTGHKKRKKKVPTQTHHKKRIVKSKARKIPRLTLKLISSTKPFNHVFDAAAKLESSVASAKKDSSPNRPHSNKANARPATTSKEGCSVRSYMEEMATEEAIMSDLVLSFTCSSMNSESDTYLKQTSASTSQHVQRSTSSSSSFNFIS